MITEKKNLQPIEVNEKNLQSAMNIIIDIETRKVTDEVVSRLVKTTMPSLKHEVKPEKTIGNNTDYAFLGAAGSGKSTISKQILASGVKEQSVVLATDNYRAFTMPGTEKHEQLVTKNVFSRTQDVAYMVKELVVKELKAKSNSRPDIIFDAVSFGPDDRTLLSTGKLTSAVAAYKGEVGFEGIAERAEKRALDPKASAADKGRYVNTTGLFEGHANGSKYFISGLPKNTQTTIYDTNVEKGEKPKPIAVFDPSKDELKIYDLKTTAEFLNKKTINTEAVNRLGLAAGPEAKGSTFSTHVSHKAKAILDLVPPQTIELCNSQGVPYLQLKKGEHGIEVNVMNETEVTRLRNDTASIAGEILKSINTQVAIINKADKTKENDKDETQKIREQALKESITISAKGAYASDHSTGSFVTAVTNRRNSVDMLRQH